MNTKKIWGPAGWPWELELLALVFVVTALVIPLWMSTQHVPDPDELSLVARAQMEKRQEVATYEDQQNFFWAVAIGGLYLVHILMAYSSLNMISTSVTHLFSPLLFSLITYYRLNTLGDGHAAKQVVSGEPLEVTFWVLGVIAITLLVARVRMARHMLRFRQVDWDIRTPSRFDSTFLKDLAITLRPLIYPPRAYRASEDGILIEGWLYIMPLPFHGLQAIEGVRRVSYSGQAQYFATSSRTLVRVQLIDSKMPIYISPHDRDQFIAYCNRRLSRGVVSLERDTSDDG